MSSPNPSSDIGTSTESTNSLRERLFQNVDSLILVYLRVGIGIAIFFWAWLYSKPVDYSGEMLPLYDPVFMKPRFLFKYAGFEWVKLWPGDGIGWHFFATKIFAVMLTVGFLTRLSGAVLCASVAYILLVERQIYLNHYYLLSCLAAWMVFLPAGRRLSVDAWIRQAINGTKPKLEFYRWQLWILRFQIGIPYVYGAIAKMNSDWMAGQPAGIFLEERRHLPFVETYLQLPSAPLMFAWGGLLYDLLVVPMLFYRKTRWIAILMSIAFHLSNSVLFNIGVFPWFMLAAVIVFFEAGWLANMLSRLQPFGRWWLSRYSDHPQTFRQAIAAEQSHRQTAFAEENQTNASPSHLGRLGFYLAATYLVIQLILPLRHWVLPGNPSWNERGHRFAWHMMLRRKAVLTTFKVVAPDGKYQFFPSTTVMTYYQSTRAERNPELVRQAAVELKKMAEEVGVKDAKIYCLCLASLNGRRPIPIINPDIDLTTVQRGWLSDDWVTQEHGPLPAQTWSQDKEQWWRQLVLPAQFKPLETRLPSELVELVEQQRQNAQNVTPPQ